MPDTRMVNVYEAVILAWAVPPETKIGDGTPAAGAARLLARAWVNNMAFAKKVWLDVDVLCARDRPVHSQTQPLDYLEPAGGAGDFFLADMTVSTRSRASRRLSAQGLQYRVYYEVNGQVFTDGIRHHHSLSQ